MKRFVGIFAFALVSAVAAAQTARPLNAPRVHLNTAHPHEPATHFRAVATHK
jgi:hypothetical protein